MLYLFPLDHNFVLWPHYNKTCVETRLCYRWLFHVRPCYAALRYICNPITSQIDHQSTSYSTHRSLSIQCKEWLMAPLSFYLYLYLLKKSMYPETGYILIYLFLLLHNWSFLKNSSCPVGHNGISFLVCSMCAACSCSSFLRSSSFT